MQEMHVLFAINKHILLTDSVKGQYNTLILFLRVVLARCFIRDDDDWSFSSGHHTLLLCEASTGAKGWRCFVQVEILCKLPPTYTQ